MCKVRPTKEMVKIISPASHESIRRRSQGVGDETWVACRDKMREVCDQLVRASTATAVKPGFFSNWRKANLRSFITQCLHWIDSRRAACGNQQAAIRAA